MFNALLLLQVSPARQACDGLEPIGVCLIPLLLGQSQHSGRLPGFLLGMHLLSSELMHLC